MTKKKKTSLGFPYTYGDNLLQEESRKRLGHVYLGAAITIGTYTTIQLLSTQVAYAADVPNKVAPPTTPPAVVTPVTGVPSTSRKIGAGFTAAICSTAVHTGEFWVGVLCGLAVVAGIITVKKK